MKRGSPSGSFGGASKRRKHESFDAASSAAATASNQADPAPSYSNNNNNNNSNGNDDVSRNGGSYSGEAVHASVNYRAVTSSTNDRISRGRGGRGVGGRGTHSTTRGRGNGANGGGYRGSSSSYGNTSTSSNGRGGGSSTRYQSAHTTAVDESFRPRVCDVTAKDKLAASAASQNKTASHVSVAQSLSRQQQPHHVTSAARSGATFVKKKARDVVIVLEKAGLLQGHVSLVDAYERAATTEIANESLRDVRPDIVHQCLLALFDSDLAAQHHLRVYINLIARVGKVIEVSPGLRPPRTYGRFCGLMSALLRDGRVCSGDGQVLMRMLPGSLAPVLPHGVEVIGVVNALASPVQTALQLAQQAQAHPVSDALQGGIKNVSAFYCVSCTDDSNLSGVDYVTRTVCLSPYPLSSHVMCSRLCEAHVRVL